MGKKLLIRLFIPSVVLTFVIITVIGLNSKNNNTVSQSGWVLQTDLQNQLRGRTVSDMTFTDSLTGYAVTPWSISVDSTFIFKTTDGGSSWFALVSQPNGSGGFNRIKFINQNTGFTCGDYFKKTTNGGLNWTTINIGGITAEMMYILNEDSIFLTYHESMTGGIFRTTNGGTNWQQIYSAGIHNPTSIYMFNSRIGFYCGIAKFYKTTDGGFNWTYIDDNIFYDIKFIDSLTGYRAFGDIQKTTNGGFNWNTQILPIIPGISTYNGALNFNFVGNDTIFSVGSQIEYGQSPYRYRGVINKTTNGGINWGYQLPDTQNIQITRYFYIKFVSTKNGWAYNKYGAGIHTSTGGDSTLYTNIQKQINEISKEFKLYQNYPNPFNPVTNIKIKMNKRGFAELKIFDITGKLKDLLINRYENAGEYIYKFDAKELSSGVYFYSLFVDGMRVDTKKLILIK